MSICTRNVISRLKSLKVMLGIDSPEIRGWAPAVQEEALKTVHAAIRAITDMDEILRKLDPPKCPVCDQTLIDGEWCENHGRPKERLNPNDYR